MGVRSTSFPGFVCIKRPQHSRELLVLNHFTEYTDLSGCIYNFRKCACKCRLCNRLNCGCSIKLFLREKQHVNLQGLHRSRFFADVYEVSFLQVKGKGFLYLILITRLVTQPVTHWFTRKGELGNNMGMCCCCCCGCRYSPFFPISFYDLFDLSPGYFR